MGLLEWSIRDSWVSYVRSLPDFRINMGRPASAAGTGFAFPVVEATLSPSGEFAVCSAGSVQFWGHDGFLQLYLGDIAVHGSVGRAEISAAVTPSGVRRTIGTTSEVTLTRSEGEAEVAFVPLLSFDGVTLFDDAYAYSTALSEVNVHFQVADRRRVPAA